jgi:hypothetical protein
MKIGRFEATFAVEPWANVGLFPSFFSYSRSAGEAIWQIGTASLLITW